MKDKKQNLESVFQEVLNQHTVEPSDTVLKKMRRKLFIRDFLSLDFRKFNIGYVGLIAISVLGFSYFVYEENLKSEVVLGSKIESVSPELENNTNEQEVDGNKIDKVENSINAVKAFYEADVFEGCAPLEIKFKNKSSNAKSYLWDFGDGSKSNKANPTHQYSIDGTYKIKLTVTNANGDKDEFIKMAKVFKKPEANFAININESELGTRSLVFENNSKSASTYLWNFGDNSTSDLKAPIHEYKSFNTYSVSLKAVSVNGCSDTITIANKFIDKDYRLSFPIQFKPSAQGANNGLYERPENEPFVFYPKNFGAQEYELKIIAPNGVEVFSTKNIKQGWNGYIRGRMAPAGVYSYTAIGVYPNGKEFTVNGKVKMVVESYYDNY